MNRIIPITLLSLFIPLCFIACGNGSESKNRRQDSMLSEDSTSQKSTLPSQSLKIGAERLIEEQLDVLQGSSVAIVANHTSVVNGIHLVDTLLALGINVTKVFAPEHGFRGAADAGAKIDNTTDPKTGLPILSLYGKTRKPSEDQLSGIDIVIFDIQDVGTRHYTYISTMSYVMEACAEQGKKMVVLDRPNPNGWYVDGPLMQEKFQSFIGLHNVPIVHGMTIGEYALMVNGEYLLKDSIQASLQVISCEGYTHDMKWGETGLTWISPSPNLASEYAAYLYPALCWFEPTIASIGRGTDEAFTILGTPWFVHTQQARLDQDTPNIYGLEYTPYRFTPVSLPGKSTYPKFQDQTCSGYKFLNKVDGKALFLASLELLEILYTQTQKYRPEETFFQRSFETWAGNLELENKIKNNISPEEIWLSWQEDVNKFREIRKQYLLYKDFE